MANSGENAAEVIVGTDARKEKEEKEEKDTMMDNVEVDAIFELAIFLCTSLSDVHTD
jgi:hypothetical protein